MTPPITKECVEIHQTLFPSQREGSGDETSFGVSTCTVQHCVQSRIVHWYSLKATMKRQASILAHAAPKDGCSSQEPEPVSPKVRGDSADTDPDEPGGLDMRHCQDV